VIAPPPAAFSDLDRDGIDDNLEQELANKYAPVILIEPNESNYPVNVEWFLERAHLQYHEDCLLDVDDDVGPNPLTTQNGLIGPPWLERAHCGQSDAGYGHPRHRTITTIGADPDGQVSAGDASTGYSDQQTFVLPDLDETHHVGSLDPLDWKTYFHAYPSADGGIVLQYWHLFAYNHLGVASYGNHGGDWDATIHVQLGPDLQVEQIWFSRHAIDHPGDAISAELITWSDETHPLITIDGGGHAAYALPEDFCDRRSPWTGGKATWPSDENDPLNPDKLVTIDCDALVTVGPPFSGHRPGGTIWQTQDGGLVVASGNLTHPIFSPSSHGGMVNLGEYNPCTARSCNGARQASRLLAGEFHPLNDQLFIEFSGKWGSLPQGLSTIEPPRGPVFQGKEDTGSEVVYRAWYNQGADVPASPATSPWRVPPETSLRLIGPKADTGGRLTGSGTTDFALEATSNAIACSFGAPRSYYRVHRVGSSPPAFTPYQGAARLPPADGDYEIEFYSLDALNNQESTQAYRIRRRSAAR
jgi:hypothetical protein